jgi:murein DD-endopeptidase MepM/ murein hydrolase activator NlpD
MLGKISIGKIMINFPWKNFLLILLSLLLCISVISTKFMADAISKSSIEAKNIEVKELQEELKNWKALYSEVLSVKEMYRKNVKEMADLLYFQNMPIGGQSPTIIKDTDKLTLKMLQDTLISFKDEQTWTSKVKDYLILRNKFINDFPFIYPLKIEGTVKLSSGFGFRTNLLEKQKKNGINFHAGLDLVAPIGTPVIATADGSVQYIEIDNPVYGKLIILSHNFELRTYYAHLSKINVKIGQKVKRGDIIGLVGVSGESLGPHLHYEMRLRDVPLDPMNFIGSSY